MNQNTSAALASGRFAALLALAALVGTTLLPAEADARRRRLVPLADYEVRTVKSITTGKHLLRAVVGVEEIYQYLTIERIRRGATEGDRDALLDQERIGKFVVGGRTRTFPSAPDIRRLRWQGKVLHFTVSDGRRYWRCMLAVGARASFLPRCDAVSGKEAGYGRPMGKLPPKPLRGVEPKVPERARSWGGDARVVKACGRALSGSKNINNCIKVAGKSKYNPVATIAACGNVMSGSSNKINCLMTSLKATEDRSMGLRACSRATSGAKNRLNCYKIATRTRYEPSRTIAACGKAMSGGRNVLNCLLVAKDADSSPHAAIASCGQTVSGSKNRLQCIKSASAR